MMTWKQVKEEIESQGLNDEAFVRFITIKADENSL